MRTRDRVRRSTGLTQKAQASQGRDQSNTNPSTNANTNLSQPKEVNEEASAAPEDLGNFDDMHIELGDIEVREVCLHGPHDLH